MTTAILKWCIVRECLTDCRLNTALMTMRDSLLETATLWRTARQPKMIKFARKGG